MSESLRIMLKGGDNDLHSVEWEPLDTPPARAWRRLIEHSNENPKDNPLHITDVAFCASLDEANNIWNELKIDIEHLNLRQFKRLPFSQVTRHHLNRLLRRLMDISEKQTEDIEVTFYVNRVVNKLKHLLFFIEHTKNTSCIKGANMDSEEYTAFGQIYHNIDPEVHITFEPEWYEHLTMDVEFGMVYANLLYANKPYHMITEANSRNELIESLVNKEFGPPKYLSNSYIIDFSQHMNRKEVDFSVFLHEEREFLKQMDSSLNVADMLLQSGVMPVAKLKTPLGRRGYLGYPHVVKTQSVFKAEFLQDY